MTKNKDKVIPLINRKILALGLIAIIVGIVLIGTAPQSRVSLLIDKITGKTQSSKDVTELILMIEGKQSVLSVPKKDLLFNMKITYDKNNNPE